MKKKKSKFKLDLTEEDLKANSKKRKLDETAPSKKRLGGKMKLRK